MGLLFGLLLVILLQYLCCNFDWVHSTYRIWSVYAQVR